MQINNKSISSSDLEISMASSSVKAEDRLEGASNCNAWKARVFNILEGDLDELITE
jgi:hypothetical protein